MKVQIINKDSTVTVAVSVLVLVSSGCLDMVAVEGQFTFTAERPQLSCAAFFMAEPNEVITVEYDNVDIDCRGGDFITVNSHKHTPHSLLHQLRGDILK